MIYWIAFILLFNLVDYFVTRRGGKPNYTKYNTIKTIAALGCFALIGNFDSWGRFFISGIVIAIFEATSFWILYELVRNIWTKQPLLYFDQFERDSGGTDRFFADNPDLHTPAKIAALVLCIFTGIIIYYS
jgi:hypothetical protein